MRLDSAPLRYNHVVVDQLSLALAAVADPTRRAILRRLAAGPAPVGDLARPFQISQQAVSKHVHLLERARLIEKRRRGRLSICSLDPTPLREIAEWTEGYRRCWEENFQRLDALLEELKAKDRKPSTKDQR